MSNPTVSIEVFEGGDLVTVALPAKFEVCWRCEGRGKHVNPSVDGHGISPEEFAEDPSFEEAYFDGVYDIQCEKCKGQRVLAVVDVEHLDEAQRRAFEEHEAQQIERQREEASEAWLRRAESGGGW